MQVNVVKRTNRQTQEESYQVALVGAGERLTTRPTTSVGKAMQDAKHLCHNLGLGWFEFLGKVVKLSD